MTTENLEKVMDNIKIYLNQRQCALSREVVRSNNEAVFDGDNTQRISTPYYQILFHKVMKRVGFVHVISIGLLFLQLFFSNV